MTIEEIIILHIPKGEQNAIKANELIKIIYSYKGINCKDRDIRQYIRDIRLGGKVIAGSSKGYFIPETIEELQRYINYAESKSNAIKQALEFAQIELERMKRENPSEYQLSLLFDDN